MTRLADPTPPSHDLRALVRQHAARFPWYADLLRQHGAAPDAPLHSLPLLDEEVLLAHYYGADHRGLPGASTYRTSGTAGGGRKCIAYHHDDHAEYVAQRQQVFERFLADVPAGATAVADLGTGHAAASAREIFTALGLCPRDIDFTAPIEHHVEALNRWQPSVLFTMPMILDRLLALGSGLCIRPRRLIVVGDLAPGGWRRHVAARLGLRAQDVLDVVGSIEVGAVAYLDQQHGDYRVHDHLLAEVVPPADPDVDREAWAAQGRGVLVLTSFARRYLPVVRYVTGDVVRGLRWTTRDGRPTAVFDHVEGRWAGDVKHGERISSHDLLTAVGTVFPGAPFVVVEGETLVIRVGTRRVGPQEAEAVRESLLTVCPDVAQLVRSGLVGPIDVVAVDPDGLTGRGAKRVLKAGGR